MSLMERVQNIKVNTERVERLERQIDAEVRILSGYSLLSSERRFPGSQAVLELIHDYVDAYEGSVTTGNPGLITDKQDAEDIRKELVSKNYYTEETFAKDFTKLHQLIADRVKLEKQIEADDAILKEVTGR